MARPRPTSVLVLAILHFVFGGLGLVCVACAGVGLAAGNLNRGVQNAPQQQTQKDIERITEEKLPYNKAVNYASLALDVVLSLLLLIGGFGLLNVQPWGRAVSLAYAPLSILIKLVELAYAVAFSLPATQAIGEELSKKGGDAATVGAALKFTAYLGLVVPLVTMIYPVAVLIILLTPSVAAAFRTRGIHSSEEPEDYDDRRQSDEERWER